jgi:hypothetical protein
MQANLEADKQRNERESRQQRRDKLLKNEKERLRETLARKKQALQTMTEGRFGNNH